MQVVVAPSSAETPRGRVPGPRLAILRASSTVLSGREALSTLQIASGRFHWLRPLTSPPTA